MESVLRSRSRFVLTRFFGGILSSMQGLMEMTQKAFPAATRLMLLASVMLSVQCRKKHAIYGTWAYIENTNTRTRATSDFTSVIDGRSQKTDQCQHKAITATNAVV